jgi:adenine-specific DNA-methyltransferase
MYPRLKLLKQFLRKDGAIFVNLDDNEAHYCKIICDEIFGRNNFLCDIAWEKRYSPPPDTKDFGYVHDHILCYRKSSLFSRNLLPMTLEQEGRYQNQDNDLRGPWKATDYTCRFNSDDRPNLYYPIIQPNTGKEIWPKKNRVWAMSKEVHDKNEKENRIWWGKNGINSVPALKNFLSEVNQGMMPMSLWKYTIAGHNQDAKKESMALFTNNNAFATPKPEKLVQLILTISTNPGDYILDSFLGSGTTAAVAHKMGRKYIGVEMGKQAKTHCAARLKKVIDGEQGGISEAVGWKSGGGFRFFTLGEAVFDNERRIKQSRTYPLKTWPPISTSPRPKLP